MDDLFITDAGRKNIVKNEIDFFKVIAAGVGRCKLKSVIDHYDSSCVVALTLFDFTDSTANKKVGFIYFYDSDNELVMWCQKGHIVNKNTVVEFNLKFDLKASNAQLVLNDKSAISIASSNKTKIESLTEATENHEKRLDDAFSVIEDLNKKNVDLENSLNQLSNLVKNQDRLIKNISNSLSFTLSEFAQF